MSKLKYGILMFIALLAIVSVASAADTAYIKFYVPDPKTSYWDIDVTVDNSGLIPVANDYYGWCANLGITIGDGEHQFNVFSSRNTADPSWPTTVSKLNWDKINWVINHKNVNGHTANWQTVQSVIWWYLGFGAPTGAGSTEGWVLADYNELIRLADLNGVGYIPYCGEKYAIILYWPGIQPIFAEVLIPSDSCRPPPGVPEFPSLALPAGMMVGMVGLVYYVRKREN